MKISVIVPVYNAEDYLCYCIDSILSQSYHNIEVILVDDGSLDTSGDICDNYANKDSRVRVCHQNNSGVSSARNKGIEMANGEYVMFADSDDYVDKEWCSTLVGVQDLFPDKLPVCNVYYVRNGQVSTKQNGIEKNLKPQKISYYEMFKMGLSGYPVNKLFERRIIIDNDIHFDEHMRIGEDVKFCIDYLHYKSGIVLTKTPLYYYVNAQDSATNRYHANRLKEMLLPFWLRIPLIDEQKISSYCDTWFPYFISMFDNVFDKRCHWTWSRKMRYNQEVMLSKQFQFCAEHISGNNEGSKFLRIVRFYNYYLLWIYQKLSAII